MKKGLIILLLLLTGCSMKEEKRNSVFNPMEGIQGEALVNSYTIYGTYFNISGELEGEHSNLVLVLKEKEVELEYPLILNRKDEKTFFQTNELINEGIDLETIKNRNYIMYLKENDIYYTLKNNSTYKELEYYTVTKENKNYQISIDFLSFDNQEYFCLQSKETKLPDNVYDIVIDPGHGGVDVGAISGKYYESNLNLSYGLLLKEELEKLGLKVKLTRQTDESIANYGKNGRVSIPYVSKAKLMLSIHMNSASGVKNGGVEVYVPNHANIAFAKSIVKNVVEKTSSNYSPNKSDKVEDGVYLRTLTKGDLETMKKDALKDGYTPYEKATTDSTYYYIIRETGGIITGAYVDERNPKKAGNPYVNSNHGCESYLLELGFMNSTSNLNILLTEKEDYIEAIVSSVKEYLIER